MLAAFLGAVVALVIIVTVDSTTRLLFKDPKTVRFVSAFSLLVLGVSFIALGSYLTP
jgi:hypothetical protein